jgi:hypothetical protein
MAQRKKMTAGKANEITGNQKNQMNEMTAPEKRMMALIRLMFFRADLSRIFERYRFNEPSPAKNKV